MPSSISSSDRVLPAVPWIGLLAGAVGLIAIGAAAIELRLSALGYEPTVRDSPERWQAERARASRLGPRAFILVGASRFQLGLDLDVLRQETGLEPVQLALDGSPVEPVLEGLAGDPEIRAAELLGISLRTLYYKLKGLDGTEMPTAKSMASDQAEFSTMSRAG